MLLWNRLVPELGQDSKRRERFQRHQHAVSQDSLNLHDPPQRPRPGISKSERQAISGLGLAQQGLALPVVKECLRQRLPSMKADKVVHIRGMSSRHAAVVRLDSRSRSAQRLMTLNVATSITPVLLPQKTAG